MKGKPHANMGTGTFKSQKSPESDLGRRYDYMSVLAEPIRSILIGACSPGLQRVCFIE